MTTLIINYIEQEYPQVKEELISYGASQKDIVILMIINQKSIYLTIVLIGFGLCLAFVANAQNKDKAKIDIQEKTAEQGMWHKKSIAMLGCYQSVST